MHDKLVEQSKNTASEVSQTSLCDWLTKNCVNPFVNTFYVESHNALANAANLASENTAGHKIMGKDALLDVGNAENMMSWEFLAQQVSAGLAMIVPQTIVGKLAGGTLRGISTATKLGRHVGPLIKQEQFVAGILNSEKTAQVVGGTLFDGLKDTHEGQSHVSNAMHSAVLFTVIENTNPLTKNLVWYKKYSALIGIGAGASAIGAVAGAATYDIQKEKQINGEHILKEVSASVISGGAMNALFPAAQHLAGKGIDHINMKLGRGAPIARLAQHQDLIGKDPEFDRQLKENPGARVQFSNNSEHKALHKENKVVLGKKWDIADLVHEGKHLNDTLTNRRVLASIRELITSGQKDEAYKQYMALRYEQENAVRRLENEVRSRHNSSTEAKQELRPNAPHKTLEEYIYHDHFQTEFQQFLKNPTKFTPETDYSVVRERTSKPVLQRPIELVEAKELAAQMNELPNAGHFKNLLSDRYVGSIPKEFLDTGLSATQVCARLDLLAKFLRCVDGMLPPGKKSGIASEDLKLPEFTFTLGKESIRVAKAGVGETASVYCLAIGGKEFALKIPTDPTRMDIHGTYSETAAFTYLSKYDISNLIEFHAANPSPSGGWLLNEFVSEPSKKAGTPVERILFEQGLILGDDWDANRGPGKIVWDIGGIEPASFHEPKNTYEFQQFMKTKDGRRIGGRRLDAIGNQAELQSALAFGLMHEDIAGQIPRTAALNLSDPRRLRDILDFALETPGAAGRAAFELDKLKGTAHLKGLFYKALKNPESRVEAIKHLDKLEHWERLEAFTAAFAHPETRAIATRFIPMLPSLQEQASARALAITDPRSRLVLELINKALPSETKNIQQLIDESIKAFEKVGDANIPENKSAEVNPIPFRTSEREEWLNKHIDAIIEKYTSKPITKQQLDNIIKAIPKEDRELATMLLKYSAGNCSDVGLLAQLKALNHASLSEPGIRDSKLLPVYTLDSTSCGNALAYLYRKVNKIEIDLRNLDNLKGEREIVLFDDLSIASISDRHRDLLKNVEQIKVVDIRAFEKGVNLFDLALGEKAVTDKLTSLVNEAKAIKQQNPKLSKEDLVQKVLSESVDEACRALGPNVQIVRSLGWRNNPLLPQEKPGTSTTSVDALYRWIVVPRLQRHKVAEFLNNFDDKDLPMATHILTNGTTYHTVEHTMAKLKKLHNQIELIRQHHNASRDSIRIVVDPKEEAGGSAHLITYLYSKANDMPSQTYISDNQLKKMVETGEAKGKWLTLMDDGLYSGNQMADLITTKLEENNSHYGGLMQFDKILIATLGTTHGFMPDLKNHEDLAHIVPAGKISALQNIWANVGHNRWLKEQIGSEPKTWSELCRYTSQKNKFYLTAAESYTPYFSEHNKFMNEYFAQGGEVASKAISIATLAGNRISHDSFCGIDSAVMSYWGTTDTNIPLLTAFATKVLHI